MTILPLIVLIGLLPIAISNTIEPYPIEPIQLSYSNIGIPLIEYHFRFRVSSIVWPNQYVRITFPLNTLPELGKITKCSIRKIPSNDKGKKVNPIIAFKDEVNRVE